SAGRSPARSRPRRRSTPDRILNVRPQRVLWVSWYLTLFPVLRQATATPTGLLVEFLATQTQLRQAPLPRFEPPPPPPYLSAHQPSISAFLDDCREGRSTGGREMAPTQQTDPSPPAEHSPALTAWHYAIAILFAATLLVGLGGVVLAPGDKAPYLTVFGVSAG